MGASASCMQITNGNRRFTRIRSRRRGYRIRRRVQSIWRLLRKLQINAVHTLWPHAAALKHRRLRRLRDSPPHSQELKGYAPADALAPAPADDHDPQPLIPGLPRDLAVRCLARVPRVLHGRLRAVARPWLELVESREFLDERRRMGVSEDWIYLHLGAAPRLDEVASGCKGGRWELVGGFSLWHALDPERYRWHALPPIPYDEHATGGHVVLGAASVVVDGELYVLGGAPFSRPALRDVWVYNPKQNRWRKGQPMLTPRFGCLVGAIERKLYVVGGSGICHLTGYSLPCLEIFDPAGGPVGGAWRYGASARGRVTQHPCSPLRHVAVVGAKLLVTGPRRPRGPANAGMYDPALDAWTDINPGLRSGWGTPSAILDGTLYTIGPGGGYREYCPERDAWVPLLGGTATDAVPAGPLEWDPRLVAAMAASNGKLYMVGTMGPALVVIVAPVRGGPVDRTVRWHTMKLPNSVGYLGDVSFCSCQVINL